jgi:hypothetical protein
MPQLEMNALQTYRSRSFWDNEVYFLPGNLSLFAALTLYEE